MIELERTDGGARTVLPELPPRRLTLRVGGDRLAAVMTGPEPALRPSLVFLHDSLGSIARWDEFARDLAQACNFGALIYDRLGYGCSDGLPAPYTRPLEYMHIEALRKLPRVLDETGIRDAVLVGHSEGASIALLAAADHDPRIAAVVAIAPLLFVEDRTVQAVRATVDSWRNTDLREQLRKYHGANVEGAFAGWSQTWLSPEFRSFNIVNYVQTIRCPILAIQGDADAYGSRAQIDAIALAAPDLTETLVLPGCGHAPQYEARDRVLAAIADFAARAIARRAAAGLKRSAG